VLCRSVLVLLNTPVGGVALCCRIEGCPGAWVDGARIIPIEYGVREIVEHVTVGGRGSILSIVDSAAQLILVVQPVRLSPSW